MNILEDNWKVLASLFPTGWQQVAWQSGDVQRFCGFSSTDVLGESLAIQHLTIVFSRAIPSFGMTNIKRMMKA